MHTNRTELADVYATGDSESRGAMPGCTHEARTRPPSQSSRLVELAESFELFVTPAREAFATVDFGDHVETWALRTREFRDLLKYRHYLATGEIPNGQAVQDALGVLEAKALFRSPERVVHTRLAAHNDAIYIDLCDDFWRVVEVTPTRWGLVADAPVRFRRARGMEPLPAPDRGGDVAELRKFVNVASDDDWRLYVSWLLGALRPNFPFAVLGLHGVQGSAKSSQAMIARLLVDPNAAPLRGMPRSEHDLSIAAKNSHVIVIDNLSSLPQWLSDALCRLATGGGLATRALYTDDEEAIFQAKRPIIITGIEDVASSSDLLDRSLVIHLPEIPDERRRDEESFWAEFLEARPRIFGALLDAVAAGLRNVADVKLERLPRMADFAKWVSACESGLGWPRGSFLASYTGNRAGVHELALEADVVGHLLCALADSGFEGTATELLERLDETVEERVRKQREWPKSGRALAGRVRRLAPNLRGVGLSLEFEREAGTGRRLIRLRRPETVTTVTAVTDAHVRDRRDGRDGDSGNSPDALEWLFEEGDGRDA